MAIQNITGNEIGSQFIEKLNNNFSQASNVRQFHVQMERGGLKQTGAMDYTIASYNGYIRSSMLIRINDATKVTGKTLTGFDVFEYGANFALVATSSEGDAFNSSTRYIKIVKQTNDIVEDAVLLLDGDVEEVYNVQIESGTSSTHLLSETLVFAVDENICTTARLVLPSGYSIGGKKVPLIIWCACDGSYPNWDFYIDQVGSSPASITSQLQYLTGQGFAVLNVYPWGSYNFTNFQHCGQSGAVPVPVTLRAYEKAVEYVTSRFNISDTNIFMTSWSGSGKLSAYYAIHHPKFNLRHIYAFSPVVDGGVWRMCETLKGSGDGSTGFRGATNSEMNFDGTTEQINRYLTGGNTMTEEQALEFKKLNAEKFAKFSSIQWQNLVGCYMKDGALHNHSIDDKVEDSLEWGETWRTFTGYQSNGGSVPSSFTDWDGLRQQGIYNRHDLAITGDGAPITIIGAEDDGACPYLAMEQFIIQLQNGGNEAKIINLPIESSGHTNTLGHRAPIFYNQVVSGIGYGWSYAVQDIKSRFLKQQ